MLRTPLTSAAMALCLVVPLAAQVPDSTVLTDSSDTADAPDSSRSWSTGPRKRPLLAVAEAMLVNVLVNRYDAVVRGQPWAYSNPDSWSRNLRLGWEWDEDAFLTNMFSHPFHGSLYFNAGRNNGLGYWQSAPISFLGSFTWEYFGERFRPSLNDFFMTSVGGIALGEVFHRVASSIRDNRLGGGTRIFREVASLPFDPMGGLNRLFRGEWSRVGENPVEHNPGAYQFRFNAGGRWVGDSLAADPVTGSATILADLDYGDPFLRPYQAPFDVFTVRVQISPDGGGLNLLRARGRLYGRELTGEGRRTRHVWDMSQRYDFDNNTAYKFGGQSVESAIESRWRLGGSQWVLHTRFGLDAILMGAIDAPYSGIGNRTYDFGPGVGFSTEWAFERHGHAWLAVNSRLAWVHTVSGAEANHRVGFGNTELRIPVAGNVGVGLHTGYFERRSRYADGSEDRREFPEVRLFMTLTTSGRENLVAR